MIPKFWFRWLQVATIGVIIYGAGLIVMPGFSLDLFSFIFFGGTGGFQARYSPEAIEYMKFIHGDLGSIIIGWGVTFFLILNGPLRRVDKGGWTMLSLPLVAWFASGIVLSFFAGYWQNVVFNLFFLLLYCIPLIATRKYF